MGHDPFADEAQQTPAPEQPAASNDRPAAPADGNKVRVTLKGGTGYDAPWITVDGLNVRDALNLMTGENAEPLAELVQQASKVGKYFAGLGGGSAKPAGGGQQAGKPAGATQAPGGSKYCDHGEMEFKSGVNNSGKAWKGHFCRERDKNAQCDPQWVK